jgi:uncharacterized phiE125 gp8 family phage protein
MPQYPWAQPRQRPLQIPRARVSVPAASLPVTLIEAKHQLSIAVDDDSHDPRLQRLIEAAVEMVESDTNQSLMVKTYVQTQPWTDSANLLFQPVGVVSAVSLVKPNASPVAVSAADYVVDTAAGTLRLIEVQTDADPTEDQLSITYTAGRATAAEVPALARHAVLLLVAFWFENPDMILADNQTSMRAYDHLKTRIMRSRYP